MDIEELRAERARTATRMREIAAAAREENRSLSGDEESERQQLVEAYDSADAQITLYEEDEERDLHVFASDDAAQRNSGANRRGELLPGETRDIDEDEEEQRQGAAGAAADSRYADIFERYLRFGTGELVPEERQALRAGFVQNTDAPAAQRALSASVGATGAYTVPTGFDNRLVEVRNAVGGMRRAPVDVINTDTGEELPFPRTNDAGEVGSLLAENTEVPELDADFEMGSLRAYVYTSKRVMVPLQLLWNTAIDLEGHLARRLGRRIARAENPDFTSGSGSGRPEGVLTAAQLGVTGPGGQLTDITWADIINIEHSVDEGYRDFDLCRYMFADSTLALLKKKLDGDGRPIWLAPDFRTNQPATLNGYQYVINHDMPAVGASAKSMAFGDFSAYRIRDVRGMQLVDLRERYAEKLQVAFFAFSYTDGMLSDATAIKTFQHAAS